MRGDERVNLGDAVDDVGAPGARGHRIVKRVDQRDECAVLAVDLVDAEIELVAPFDQAHRWLKPRFPISRLFAQISRRTAVAHLRNHFNLIPQRRMPKNTGKNRLHGFKRKGCGERRPAYSGR